MKPPTSSSAARLRRASGGERPPAAASSPSTLVRGRFLLLTTFRASGEPVSTPMWFAARNGRMYLVTACNAGKLGRLRADPRVLVAPCRSQGRPLGPAVAATATLLEPHLSADAARALSRRYLLPSWLIERFLRRRGRGAPPVYIELTVTEADERSDAR